jgi:hypothetical protein
VRLYSRGFANLKRIAPQIVAVQFYGPKDDGTYIVEFRTAAGGEALAISIPRSKASVIRHFQARMPYGLFVPDVP